MPINSRLLQLAQVLETLADALPRLDASASVLGHAPLASREWWSVLREKLLPQLTADPLLLVAICGGTNIGKSTILNHIAGYRASRATDTAAGTKHPVALVPERLLGGTRVAELFSEFDLRQTGSADGSLLATADDLMFLQPSADGPANLVVIDCPDIDSNAPANWARAERVRRAADVLVAVLTPQNYNNAAIKAFFRKAAGEAQTVLVIFNKVSLPNDDAHWRGWLETFCSETGLTPESVYLAPYDRSRAEELNLAFYRREIETDAGAASAETTGVNLLETLSESRFEEIKLRSLEGALASVCSETTGLPQYLADLRQRAGRFAHAAQELGHLHWKSQSTWPLPDSAIVREFAWRNWHAQREGFSKHVHGLYQTVGSTFSKAVIQPVRGWWGNSRPPVDPWHEYKEREWDEAQRILKDLDTRLESLRGAADRVLADRLAVALGGQEWERLMRELRTGVFDADHAKRLEQIVAEEFQTLRQQQPTLYQWMNYADTAGAVVRPAITVAMLLTGAAAVPGHLAFEGVVHVTFELASGAATAVIGETALAKGTGFVQQLAAWFRQVRSRFAAERAQWLASTIRDRLVGSIEAELVAAAGIPELAEFRAVEDGCGRLVR